MPLHKQGKGNKGLWGCMWCGFTSHSEKSRTDHFIKMHTKKLTIQEDNKGLLCSYCPERFRTVEGRQFHIDKEHQGISELKKIK